VNQLKQNHSHGVAVNYEGLVDNLMDHILPDHFEVAMGNEERRRIKEVSGVYSKGRGDANREWEEDSEKKEEMATDDIREASSTFLRSSYQELEQYVRASQLVQKKVF